MDIIIGETYEISNLYKKSFVESVNMTNPTGDTVNKILVWRSGIINITPMNEHEVESLIISSDKDWEGVFECDEFENYEFIESWDGCWEEYSSDSLEDIDTMKMDFEEDDELMDKYFSFDVYLEESLGYDYYETVWTIESPIVIKNKK